MAGFHPHQALSALENVVLSARRNLISVHIFNHFYAPVNIDTSVLCAYLVLILIVFMGSPVGSATVDVQGVAKLLDQSHQSVNTAFVSIRFLM